MSIFIKNKLISFLNRTDLGKELLFQLKRILGRLPKPDLNFPQLISLEISSQCNLACVHCPPHAVRFRNNLRTYGFMNMDLFLRLMDEIDQYGVRRIALHKDGEPLLHPSIFEIIRRVKKNVNHTVYLSTNGQKLTNKLSLEILENQIDIVNFSIGAFSKKFYEKVRGKQFDRVLENIHSFLELQSVASFKPRTLVQMINLFEYPEIKNEIYNFRKYWKKYDVYVDIWDKLNWGVLNNSTHLKKRYPCYSLWESFNINSDGLVTACCIDWRQQLVIGDANEHSIKAIWHGEKLRTLRQTHIEGKENSFPICKRCNYWSWLPRLSNYLLKPSISGVD